MTITVPENVFENLIAETEIEGLIVENKNNGFANLTRIFEVVAGSHAYGLNTENSDVDIRGIFVKPFEMAMALSDNIEQINDASQDIQFYELKKFFLLAMKNNPSVLEMLWIPDVFINYIHPSMQKILDNRHLFLSKKIAETYSGYAFSQLKKMKRHKKWIDNPVTKPIYADYITYITPDGLLPEITNEELIFLMRSCKANRVKNNVYHLWNSSEIGRSCFPESTEYVIAESSITLADIKSKKVAFKGTILINGDELDKSLKQYNHYLTWKKNRNKKRSALEEVHGYDTKHAMHLFRLLKMGLETLQTGEIEVKRHDAEYLLGIKNGMLTYDEIIKEAENLQLDIKAAFEKSLLPKSPNIKKIQKLYFDIVTGLYDSQNVYKK